MPAISVYIVESPGDLDLLDDRHEGRILCQALSHSQVPAKLYTAVNSKAFFEAIKRILNSVEEDVVASRFPILHLSMHGDEQGVTLTDGHPLEWELLGDVIDLMNDSSSAALLVCMSTCNGFSGVQMAQREKSPFLGLVGPTQDIKWTDTVGAFVAFYHHLQGKNGSVTSGVKAMNAVLAEELFKAAQGMAIQQQFVIQKALERTIEDETNAFRERLRKQLLGSQELRDVATSIGYQRDGSASATSTTTPTSSAAPAGERSAPPTSADRQ